VPRQNGDPNLEEEFEETIRIAAGWKRNGKTLLFKFGARCVEIACPVTVRNPSDDDLGE
jgi:hypothetical protein